MLHNLLKQPEQHTLFRLCVHYMVVTFSTNWVFADVRRSLLFEINV